jgi:hypothetical protein
MGRSCARIVSCRREKSGSALDAIEAAVVGLEAREALGVGEVALVGEVVRGARERVDDLDRRAHGRGKKPGRDGKVLGVLDRQGEGKRLIFRDYIGWRAGDAPRRGPPALRV